MAQHPHDARGPTPASPPASTPATAAPPRTIVITCAVLEDEVVHYGRDMAHIEHVEMLEQGLHNDPPRLRRQVQAAIDDLEQRFPQAQAIVLGYGLCSRGTEGLITQRCRLVIARAHDCITHLLGSHQRYTEYVSRHPGTYWYSPGWNRHHTPPGPQRHAQLLAQYTRDYGADNAAYLMEAEQHWFHTYNRATYVHLTIGATERDIDFSRDCARWLNWSFDVQQGAPSLLRDLLAGAWDDERFCIIEPGQTFRMTADDRVVEAIPASQADPLIAPSDRA